MAIGIKYKLIFIGLILSSLLIGFGFRQATKAKKTAKARQEIEANYRKMDEAMMKKDFDAFFAFYSSDYQSSDAKGKVLKLEDLKAWGNRVFGKMQNIEQKSTIQSFVFDGEVVTCTVHNSTEGVMKHTGSGRTANLGVSDVTKATWIQTPQGWKIKNYQMISSEHFKNGKLISQK